jgi:hypothetical protein
MKIITAYPVIKDGKVISNKIANNTLNYSSLEGKKTTKVQEFLQKAKDAGLGDAALKTITALKQSKKAPAPAPMPAPAPEKQGMSTTTKVLIGVGAIVLLGGIFYAVKKK